ncbi:AGAP010009-PA, partial [Anopheles gambiae str. PEST]
LLPHNQRTIFTVAADSLAASKSVAASIMECESRTHDDDMAECVASIESVSCAQLGNINLPHKKRLAKKMTDTKGANPNYGPSSSLHPGNNGKGNTLKAQQSPSASQHPGNSFSCQLCGKVVQDQRMFFNHLKEHYEPSLTPVALDGKKAKPKLPRVKHTKKLKNDRTMKQGQAAEEQNPAQNSDAKALLSTSTSSSASCAKTVDSLLQHQSLNDAMIVLECSENGGEFSETEDMLEGIRNVVQKVQETVDTDTTEELCIANSADWFPNHADDANNGSAVAAGSTTTTAMQQPEKSGQHMALSRESLDSHEIHIPSGGDNFLLLLSKAQFNDAGMISPQNLQQLQPLHSTPFPLLSTVDALAESRAVSFQSTDSLNPLTSILLSSNTISKLSVASFAPSHCGQISDLRETRLLKREQKSDEDDDYEPEPEEEEEEENGEETPQYNEMQIIDLGASGVEPLNDESTGARNEPPIDDDYQCSDDEGVASQVQGNEDEEVEEEEEEMCSNDKERRTATDAGSNAKVYKYLCPIEECGRWFKSKTAFSYHHLQHTGERPYQCQTCQKCFFTCSALKVHERLHSGEKPYKCEECGHHFRQWGDLKYHKISKHSNEKSHKCEFCGKEFARRYSLVLHRRIHTNEKNFVCEYCNKAFRASTYLQAHRMIHTGEKPHQCSLCDKKFRCHGDLNRHQKTHSR